MELHEIMLTTTTTAVVVAAAQHMYTHTNTHIQTAIYKEL